MPPIYEQHNRWIIDQVQVNIPFNWLMEGNWLDLFLGNHFNPEIGLDAAALDRYTPADFADVARRFHENGRSITLHGPFLDLSPGSPDPSVREVTRMRLEQAIAAAEVFAPKTVVCHAGYDPSRYDFVKELWLEHAAETWNHMANRLDGIGSRLMLENVYETRPEQVRGLFDRLDSTKFGCCLDIGHLNVFSDRPLSDWVEVLGPFIGQLHLHDNDGTFDQHSGLGNGSIDTAPLAGLFSNGALPPVITLEPHEKSDLQTSIRFLSDLKWFRQF